MSLLHLFSYGAAVVAFLFITLSLASGLLWLSELIEERSSTAKVVGTRGIYAIIAIHALLYFTDSLPLPKIAFSIFCHVVYLQNFSNTWPLISLTSPSFIASCVLVIADHFLWFFHFARLTHEAKQRSHRAFRQQVEQPPSFGDMATFFGICVWLAPLFLFLSLSANDNALPTAAGKPSVPNASAALPAAPSRSLFRSLVATLPTNYLPSLRPRMMSRRTASDGIIAPHSPGIRRTSSPVPVPMTPTRSLNNLPPRTPTRSSSDTFESAQASYGGRLTPTPGGEFELSPPPPPSRKMSATLMGSSPALTRRR
ncbi:DUF396-domain-containing protein [Dentipellis sp. KUC8613]|nr:DUF396-domain-containing protein [Dentipellis sp. KUC8613]